MQCDYEESTQHWASKIAKCAKSAAFNWFQLS